MKLKNTWMKILALSLVLALLFPCALAEDAMQEEPDLLEAFMECDTIPELFQEAEKALQEKADPAKVRDAMYTVADTKNMYPYFSYAIEDYVAMGGKAYTRLMDIFGGEESYKRDLWSDWTTARSQKYDISFNAYSTNQASSKFKSMYGDKSAQCNVSSYFLTEADFKTLFKKDFSKFVPSRPRPGYVCVVVKSGAQSWPKKAYKDSDDSLESDDFLSPLREILDAIYSSLNNNGSETPPPVITGNPNLASSFLVYNVSYTYNGKYTANGTHVTGYNTVLSMTLKDAATKKDLAKYNETVKMKLNAGMYFKWDNGVMKVTDLPDFSKSNSFQSFTKSLASEIRKQDNLTSASRPVTESNAKTVLNGILQAQADGATAWETAIYESGAEDITFDGSKSVTFSLRNFNPNLKKLGAYADAKDPGAWLDSALQRISKHNLTVTLNLSNGVPTKKSLNELKATVQKAAKSARKAYSSEDMTAALKDRFFPSPVKGEASASSKLFQQTEQFTEFYEKYLSGRGFITCDLFSAICYAQKSLTVNTKKGPHDLSLVFTGVAKPDKYVSSAANQVVNVQAFKPLESRDTDGDPEEILLKRIAKNAVSSHTKAKDTFTLTVDVDDLNSDTLPSAFRNYLDLFDLRETAELMSTRITNLPDIAAIEKPDTRLLSGGKSGKTIIINIPSHSVETYVQVRNKITKEKSATMFIHPGKSVTFKLPAGDYYLVYCSGTYWYGEKNFFMEPERIFYSDPFDVPSNLLRKELTLEPVDDGTIGIYNGSPKDLAD